MAVKNPTQWQAPSGTGYFNNTGGKNITTLAGANLTTLALVQLTTDVEVYQPKFASTWTLTSKNKSQWTPGSGAGYVLTVGNELFVTNSGSFLITNSSNNIVTNPTYNTPKNASVWTPSGA